MDYFSMWIDNILRCGVCVCVCVQQQGSGCWIDSKYVHYNEGTRHMSQQWGSLMFLDNNGARQHRGRSSFAPQQLNSRMNTLSISVIVMLFFYDQDKIEYHQPFSLGRRGINILCSQLWIGLKYIIWTN